MVLVHAEKIKFPPGSGALGYDLENPSMPTEHNYEDPGLQYVINS